MPASLPSPQPDVTVPALVEFFAAAAHALFGITVIPALSGIGYLGRNVCEHALQEDLVGGLLATFITTTGVGFALLAGLHSLAASWAWLAHSAVPGPHTLPRAVRYQGWTLRWIALAGAGPALGTTALIAWFMVAA